MSTNAVLKRLNEERAAAVDFIEQTMAAVEEEARDLSDTETRSLEAQRDRIKQIDDQIKPLAEFEQVRASAMKIDGIHYRTVWFEHGRLHLIDQPLLPHRFEIAR